MKFYKISELYIKPTILRSNPAKTTCVNQTSIVFQSNSQRENLNNKSTRGSIRTQCLSENNNIQPEDSISNVWSRVSSRASSRRSSLRSTTSSRAKVAARKAALEVQAATLGRLHELEIEELKLQQRKKELHLRGEIATAKAEVYEQVEAEELSGFQCHSSSAKTMPAVQSNIIPMNELTKHDKPNWTTDNAAPNSTHVPCHNKSNSVHDESLDDWQRC